jgi:predicted dienelactone hydrolase
LNLTRIVLAFFVAALLLAAPPVRAAGFQYGTAPDPDDKPIELGIWYPSDAPTTSQPLGLFTQNVAYYGAISGQSLPLIVISHGTGGGGASHYDTAIALADAGFVVVAPTHTGDNYQDRSYSFTPRNFVERPRQVSKVIDFMLNSWNGHDHIDPARIGMFGHSAGGATALIELGGNPDISLVALYCRKHPDAWDCEQAKTHAAADTASAAPDAEKPPDWHHDPRVKAAVIAAPAIGYAFTKDGLAAVTAPIQLWRAENDKIAANEWNSDIVRVDLPKPPEDHLAAKAGHFDFLAPCTDALAKVAAEICASAPGFDRTAFHADFNKALVAFFKAQLGSSSP